MRSFRPACNAARPPPSTQAVHPLVSSSDPHLPPLSSASAPCLSFFPLAVRLPSSTFSCPRDLRSVEELEKEAESVNAPDLGTMERCNILLGDMRTNPLAEWFLEPVDYVGLGLTDYPQVIQTPMDLGTVAKKMERSQYMSTEDFAHDVRLVWQNAITYNSPQSMFGIVASILAQIFDRRFALITRSATADPGRPIPDREGWPTFQQKKKFYDLCTRLTLADLNQMVSLVQRGCSSAVQQCGDKEVEVDVDELDMETFNRVMQWATSKTKTVSKAES